MRSTHPFLTNAFANDSNLADTTLYEARYRALVSCHADLISRFRPDGTLSFVSPSYCEFFGQSEQDLIGSCLFNSLPLAENIDEVRERLARITSGNPAVRGENDMCTSDGTVRSIDWVNHGIFDSSNTLVEIQSVGRDITEQKRLERELKENQRQLEYAASHDALTDLPNRQQFLYLLKISLSDAKRDQRSLGILFIDLNGFKQVNDTLGHLCGDELLRRMAQRLRGCMRSGDMICRYGGDEFVALLGGADRLGTNAAAQRIHRAIGVSCDFGGSCVSLDASIGTAIYPEDGDTGKKLLQVADHSMYKVKHSGKNNRSAFHDLEG